MATYLLRVNKDTLGFCIPRPKDLDLQDGDVVEVTVKKVVVDEATRKRMGEKGVKI